MECIFCISFFEFHDVHIFHSVLLSLIFLTYCNFLLICVFCIFALHILHIILHIYYLLHEYCFTYYIRYFSFCKKYSANFFCILSIWWLFFNISFKPFGIFFCNYFAHFHTILNIFIYTTYLTYLIIYSASARLKLHIWHIISIWYAYICLHIFWHIYLEICQKICRFNR